MDILTQGDGPTRIVAVHGIQGTRAVWRPLAETMRGQATFVLPNLRGRGAAARGSQAADYGLRAFAADLAHVIDAATRGEPYCLAGWSMGVTVSLAALPQLSHRPKKLILMSGSPALCALQWFRAREGAALADEIAAREARLNLADAADRDAVAWTWQGIRDTDQRGVLASVDIPALIVHGAADDECPLEHAHWLREGLPRARLDIIAGAGHGIPTTHTAEVATAVRRFLSD
ncbi:alpha/beta hydrolase [Caballeronia pedi]|uniref:Alpha/beta hydrolase n=1 Tax=Caballeronia pedi TaxID=1777141 RepID=A0A157ZNV7_9BURK|nr:alpha/beta hydrolase [Caballeronia pedi]SAK46657.1 alpha/beta hydrolase [Caballeronia pedi]